MSQHARPVVATEALRFETFRSYWWRPGNLLLRAQRAFLVQFGRRCGGSGLTWPQFEMLRALGAHCDGDQVTLARAAGVDRSTTTLILDVLARRGLAARSVDPADRRRRRLRLTPAGEASLAWLQPRAPEAHRAFLQPLQPDDAQALVGLLGRIVTGATSAAPPWLGSFPGSEEAAAEAARLMGDAGFLLRRTIQILHALILDRARDRTVTPTQYGVLYLLNTGFMDERTLRQFHGGDRSTTNRLLAGLRAKGLVAARESGPLLRLSPEGRAAFEVQRGGAEAAEAALLAVLSSEEQGRLLALLDVLVRAERAD